MKRFISMICVLAMAAFMLSACAMQAKPLPPQALDTVETPTPVEALSPSAPDLNSSSYSSVVNTATGTITFKVKILPSQVAKEGLDPGQGGKLFLSYFYGQDGDWVYVYPEKQAYALPTQLVKEGNNYYLVANFTPKYVGNGAIHTRMWGRVFGVKPDQPKWLWIDQKNLNNRMSQTGKPGYEELFDMNTGDKRLVKKLQVRE